MFSNFLTQLIVLHAGTPAALSQATLTLMFVVLGVLLIGIGFGFLAKNKESLLQHRWSMSVAIVMASAAIFLVMVPSAFKFYIDPDVEFFSTLSIMTIIILIASAKAIIIALYYQHLRYEGIRLAVLPLAAIVALAALAITAIIALGIGGM